MGNKAQKGGPTIRLDTDIDKAVRDKAYNENVTLTRLINQLLRGWVAGEIGTRVETLVPEGQSGNIADVFKYLKSAREHCDELTKQLNAALQTVTKIGDLNGTSTATQRAYDAAIEQGEAALASAEDQDEDLPPLRDGDEDNEPPSRPRRPS